MELDVERWSPNGEYSSWYHPGLPGTRGATQRAYGAGWAGMRRCQRSGRGGGPHEMSGIIGGPRSMQKSYSVIDSDCVSRSSPRQPQPHGGTLPALMPLGSVPWHEQ